MGDVGSSSELSIVFNVLIVDGDRESRRRLADTFAVVPPFRVIATAQDVVRTVEIARAHPVDFVVLAHPTEPCDQDDAISFLRSLAPYARFAAASAPGRLPAKRADVIFEREHVVELVAAALHALGAPLDLRQLDAPEDASRSRV